MSWPIARGRQRREAWPELTHREALVTVLGEIPASPVDHGAVHPDVLRASGEQTAPAGVLEVCASRILRYIGPRTSRS